MSVATWVWPYSVHTSDGHKVIPSSAIIISVNGKPCVGRCGSCGNPISVEDDYSIDEARDLFVCKGCLEVAGYDGS